jgi:hypothetical protein
MQQVIIRTERHKEYSYASQLRFDGEISIRPIYPTLRMNLLVPEATIGDVLTLEHE